MSSSTRESSAANFDVAVVEDNPGDFVLLREGLREAGADDVALKHYQSLRDAIDGVRTAPVDLVLLDLSLPDGSGLGTLRRFQSTFPDMPVIVLTGLDDDRTGMQAVKEGAQDFLVKGQSPARSVARSMRYAVERNRSQRRLRDLSEVDELTALYNRRGFYDSAARVLRRLTDAKHGVTLLFMDLDGLKGINDAFGHEAGDRAIQLAAEALRRALRDDDVIGRIGGDELIALAVGIGDEGRVDLIARIEASLAAVNAESGEAFQVRLSIGAASPAEGVTSSVEQLLVAADAQMYEQKRSKRRRK